MKLQIITEPAAEPVSVSEFEAHIRATLLDDETAAVGVMIQAVRQRAEAITRRALVTQQWRLTLDGFPFGRTPLNIPLPPLQSVESIKYINLSGVEVTISDAAYRVLESSVVPVVGTQWPVALCDFEVVTVEFTCGYGPLDEEEADNVPAAIKQWILMNAATLYEIRETAAVTTGTLIDFSTIADGLLDNFRVLRW